MKEKIYIGTLAAIIWVAAIVGKHFWSDLDTGAIVGACFAVLTALGVFHVASGPDAPAQPAAPAVAPPAQPGQGGFAFWAYPLLLVPLALAAALLAGCTTTTASMYSGIYTQAKAGVQVFDDNSLTTMRDLVCAQPYAAIQRHPEMQPGIVALCGPLVNTTSLDPAQVASMLSIAKQLGLVPVPAKPASAP